MIFKKSIFWPSFRQSDPRFRASECTDLKARTLNISLSALGGGEGRGEVGSGAFRAAAQPTSPSRRCRAGPLPLSPQAGGEGERLDERSSENVCMAQRFRG